MIYNTITKKVADIFISYFFLLLIK